MVVVGGRRVVASFDVHHNIILCLLLLQSQSVGWLQAPHCGYIGDGDGGGHGKHHHRVRFVAVRLYCTCIVHTVYVVSIGRLARSAVASQRVQIICPDMKMSDGLFCAMTDNGDRFGMISGLCILYNSHGCSAVDL